MLKVLIVDDEFQGRNFLSKVLSHLDTEIEVVGEAATIDEAINLIRRFNPQIVFLDVLMKNESGFDLFQKLDKVNFEVVFTTAHDEYAVRAFKVNAIDYLLKPIDIEELQQSIDKVKKRQGSGGIQEVTVDQLESLVGMIKKGTQLDRIAIPSANGLEMVPTNTIVYCESDGNYTNFFLTGNRNILSSYTLKHYAEILPEPSFYRIHKSHLVNVSHITKYLKGDGGSVLVTGGKEVEVSKRSKDGLLKILKGSSRGIV